MDDRRGDWVEVGKFGDAGRHALALGLLAANKIRVLEPQADSQGSWLRGPRLTLWVSRGDVAKARELLESYDLNSPARDHITWRTWVFRGLLGIFGVGL